jgi:hypothetical protein
MRFLPLLTLLVSASLHAATDCPPTPTQPTQEQVQQALKTASNRGALWKLSKDGRSSYLYGTLHLGKFEWLFPGPNLGKALRETEVLAVEVDVTDPAFASEAQRLQAAARPLPLSADEQRRLDAQADAACLPRGALANLHPVMQAITYVALAGRRDGLQPGFGQEMALIGAARQLKRPVLSLETAERQLSVLLPADEGRQRYLFNSSLEALEKGLAAGQLKRLGEHWLSGDLGGLESLEQLCQCTPSADDLAFHRAVNDDRNPELAERVDAEHAKGKPLLAAIGLLHMTGPKALPALLAARGFAVERLH